MRIAFFVHRFPVMSEVFIANAAAGLIELGHDVDIYALDGLPEPRQQRHEIVSAYGLERRTRSFAMEGSPRRQAAAAPLAGLKVAAVYGSRIGAVANNSLFADGHGGLKALHEASMFRHGGRYDILHCQFGTLADPVLGHRRAGFLSGKVVVHFRGYDISQFVEKHGSQVYARVAREADAFIANCQFFRDRAIALGAAADRTHVIASGVALGSFGFTERAWTPGRRLRLLAVGRLVEKKGFRFAIEAVARLASQGMDVELKIVGGGPLGDVLQSQAAMLGVSDRVEFAGAATQSQIAQWLGDSHMFIAPSTRAADGDSDASINTLKEAMATGCPFVTSDHGGIPELVEGVDAGVMVREGDAEALAEGIVQLLDRRSEWSAMGRRGREHVLSKYSIEAVSRDLVKIYTCLLAPAAGGTSAGGRQ
ncbi:MAG TPA: glycosyltransferase [Hyphomonadaceae bacterium]|nr:glycosyltransferase [Hyphomonadaceae bacterium]